MQIYDPYVCSGRNKFSLANCFHKQTQYIQLANIFVKNVEITQLKWDNLIKEKDSESL